MQHRSPRKPHKQYVIEAETVGGNWQGGYAGTEPKATNHYILANQLMHSLGTNTRVRAIGATKPVRVFKHSR